MTARRRRSSPPDVHIQLDFDGHEHVVVSGGVGHASITVSGETLAALDDACDTLGVTRAEILRRGVALFLDMEMGAVRRAEAVSARHDVEEADPSDDLTP